MIQEKKIFCIRGMHFHKTAKKSCAAIPQNCCGQSDKTSLKKHTKVLLFLNLFFLDTQTAVLVELLKNACAQNSQNLRGQSENIEN